MEQGTSTKRKWAISYEPNTCIICHAHEKKHALQTGSEKGLQSLEQAAQSRREANDLKNIDAIDCIEEYLSAEEKPPAMWHRLCFGEFTHKGKIERLKKKVPSESTSDFSGEAASVSKEVHTAKESKTTRRKVVPMNWNMCIFCQKASRKQKLISISS